MVGILIVIVACVGVVYVIRDNERIKTKAEARTLIKTHNKLGKRNAKL